MNKKRTVLIIGCALAVVLLATAVYVVVKITNTRTSDTAADQRDFSQLATEARDEKIENNADFAQITARYSALHQQVQNEVRTSDPATWDREMVEKAYFVIEVSRKVSEYPIIDVMLIKLAAAKEAGVNIDIESIGADQAYRDDMRTLTNDALSNPDYLPTDTVRKL
ncbi:MAG: hypothetical protein ACREGE_04005 [Candidatus Microsaccharimonas sp.]